MKPDRSWKRIKFGEVAHEVSESTRTPLEDGFERYVGLEHFDPDSLSLKRWGMIAEDNPTFTKVFRAGQLLFGRRRAYQRKAAVADFDGICSGDIIVMEAKPEQLIPELLPFIVQSEGFWDYAIHTSAGSLSPRTKWANLAAYEFPLPQLDEQRHIAEILWAVEETIEQYREVVKAIENAKEALFSQFIRGGLHQGSSYKVTEFGQIPVDWVYVPCKELFTQSPRNGLSPQVNSQGVGYPTMSISAVRDGTIEFEGNLKYAEITGAEAEQFRIEQNDILVVRGNGNKMLVGRCGIVLSSPPEGCFYPDLLIRIRFDQNRIRPRFAALLWNHEVFHLQLRRRAKSSNGIWKINGDDLRKHKLIVPPLLEQDDFMRRIDILQASINHPLTSIEKLKKLKTGVINRMLGLERLAVDVQ